MNAEITPIYVKEIPLIMIELFPIMTVIRPDLFVGKSNSLDCTTSRSYVLWVFQF